MSNLKLINYLKGYSLLLKFYVIYLILGFIIRCIFMLTFSDNYSEIINIIFYGIRMDTIIYCIFAFISLPFVVFNMHNIFKIYFSFIFIIYLLLEYISFYFFQKFGFRPNYLFFEYLNNYNEVFGTIIVMYFKELIFLVLIFLIIIIFIVKIFNKKIIGNRLKYNFISLPFIIVVLFIGIRSSFDASTPSPSFHSFSNNLTSNEIAANTIFSLGYVYHKQGKETKLNFMKNEEALLLTQSKMKENFLDNNSLLRDLDSNPNKEQKNVILIMLESFGSKYVGYLGGTASTPNLDNLIKEGLLFENMYAQGNRTHWGVSSVLTSLYSPPSSSYLKLSKSQKNFYTLAKSFKKNGYENIFVYGGDSSFDNMSGFMLNNGYDKIYDKFTFNNQSSVKSNWGYPDGELYSKIINIIKEQKGKFFITGLTISSHEPFDYPQSDVELLKEYPAKGFANSIKYADLELWKFYNTLKKENLLQNTILAFVSDHGAEVTGEILPAISKNRIVGLIIDDQLKEQNYSNVVSQVDFGVTLLGLANIQDKINLSGQDLTKIKKDNAIMVYLDNIICIDSSKTIIYNTTTKTHKAYKYQSSEEYKKEYDSDLKDCLAQLQSANIIYNK